MYFGFVVQVHAHMIDHSQADPEMPMVNWDDCGVFFHDDLDNVVGCITYAHVKWIKRYSIKLGYVMEDHRSGGVYRSLWEALVAKAQTEQVPIIDGTTHLSNTTMRAVASALGRVEESVNLRYYVPLPSC